MAKKFKNKYRSESLRLKECDYSAEGLYFITICTQKRLPYFGTISKDRMILSEAGNIVAAAWSKTSKIRDRVILGEWVVMPNHLHGLIYLKPKVGRDASNASPNENESSQGNEYNRDGCNPSLPLGNKNKFGPQRDNIPSIIRGFKSTCTRKIRSSQVPSFQWQRGYYDHIVRNQQSLIKIEEYIRENPRNWLDDDYYEKNLDRHLE